MNRLAAGLSAANGTLYRRGVSGTSYPSSYFNALAPLAFAHRGGALTGGNSGVENSLAAFAYAYELGFRFLETDVRCTADGVPYACHDKNLSRLTGRDEPISAISSSELDAELLSGREPVVRLDVLLSEFQDARFNIDVKSKDAIEATCATIERLDATHRVCVASFSHQILRRLRRRLPGVANSASAWEVTRLRLGLGMPVAPDCFQVPRKRGPITVVTGRVLRRVHRAGKQLHVWTIDDRPTMHELLDLGVDGIMSDRIDVLKEVLQDRAEWSTPT